MNPAKDCFIKLKHPISCKKHNPIAIFLIAKEYTDQTIASYVF